MGGGDPITWTIIRASQSPELQEAGVRHQKQDSNPDTPIWDTGIPRGSLAAVPNTRSLGSFISKADLSLSLPLLTGNQISPWGEWAFVEPRPALGAQPGPWNH